MNLRDPFGRIVVYRDDAVRRRVQHAAACAPLCKARSSSSMPTKISSLTHGPDDALCCPSQRVNFELILRDGRLQRL